MAGKIKILGIQTSPETGNKDANLEKAAKILEQNSLFKPDLVVLSEVFNTGLGYKYFHTLSEEIPQGQTIEFLSGLASKYRTNIAGGSIIEKCSDGKYTNTSIFFDRNGKISGKYQKIHLFSYYGDKEGEYLTSGDSAVVIDSDIGKIGLSVCYDLRFPELYRALTYAGAEIITCSAAWPQPRLDHWLTLNKARAIENQVFMVSVNQTGKVGEKRINAGNSMIINPWGEVISSLGDEEGIVTAEIDLNVQKKLKEEFPVTKDRNTEAYRNVKIF